MMVYMEQNTARVVAEHKTQYVIRIAGTEYTAVVRGKILLNGRKDFPKVGDYVTYTELGNGQAVIETILPRTTQIIRKTAIGNEPQVIVANVDVMFIVMGLDGDYNPNRLERYLMLAEQSAVQPVIVLNKIDAIDDAQPFLDEVGTLAHNVPIHAVSAVTGLNMGTLRSYITADTTAVLLGSSGAGKSTIMNWFLGDTRQDTQSVREDDSRGRHTTTSRELFALPDGGYLIDTPGMRALALFNTKDPTSDVFGDIETLISQCQFSDCDHQKSRGCAVQRAIYDGVIEAKHFANYCKLKSEEQYLASKVAGGGEATANKERVKKAQKLFRRTLYKQREEEQ